MSILSRVVGLVSRNGDAGAHSARFVVMSPLNERAGERKIILRLLDAGLSEYHLRRPQWSMQRCREWLEALPAEARSRIVLHQHPRLVRKHGLAGFHFDASEKRAFPPAGGVAGAGEISAQCGDFQSMLEVGKYCRRIVLGPVFPPEKYDVTVPRRTLGEYAATAAYWRAHVGGGAQVLAFGGINASNVRECRKAGFDGVVVVGAVWNAPDPVAAFKTLMRKW